MPNGGKKKLLVLATEPVDEELDDSTRKKPQELRPLLKVMHDVLNNVAQFKAVVGSPGYLQGRTKAKLDRDPPDVIVTVASAATEAAKSAVDDKYKNDPNCTPIVFTVVSDPESQGLVSKGPDGKLYGKRLTGVSRSLLQTVVDCAIKCSAFFAGDFDLYWVWRPGVFQSNDAHGRLMAPGALPARIQKKFIRVSGASWPQIEQELRANLKVQPKPPRAGFLLIPDDLTVACADDCLRVVQDEFGIPVFVQQLELVCPGPWGAAKRYAQAGYGVWPDWVGKRAADYVGQVLRVRDQASKLPVVFPHEILGTPSPLELWANKIVADKFGLAIPTGFSACPPRKGPPAGESAARAASAAAKAAPTRAAKKPAKKRPAPKRRATGKGKKAKGTATAKQTAARRKRTASRRRRSGGRRPGRK